MLTIQWSPYKENMQYGSSIRRYVHANYAHVQDIARTRKTQTAPAAGDLMSGNRGSGRPCTYLTGKFPTSMNSCGIRDIIIYSDLSIQLFR